MVYGKVDTIGYTIIISSYLDDSAKLLRLKKNYLFQQDNATCHVSKYTQQYLTKNKIKLLNWPSESPDLNIIENVWSYMKRNLSQIQIKNKKDLIDNITRIWYNIPKTYIKTLYKSIPKRIELVIRNKGSNIPY